jgi:hypothetical protein
MVSSLSPYLHISILLSCNRDSTHQIYGLLLEIKGSMLDVRWTYFQAPLQVEDAMGRKFPVPSEYDFSLLQAIIQHRFRDNGTVALMVQKGDYELSYAKQRNRVLSANTGIRPGSQIVMAVILEEKAVRAHTCPIQICGSIEVKASLGGGYRW